MNVDCLHRIGCLPHHCFSTTRSPLETPKGAHWHRKYFTTSKGETKPEITGWRCPSEQDRDTSKGETTPTFRETSRASKTRRRGNIVRRRACTQNQEPQSHCIPISHVRMRWYNATKYVPKKTCRTVIPNRNYQRSLKQRNRGANGIPKSNEESKIS